MSFEIQRYKHGNPCSAQELERAELALGHPLPEELKKIYTIANGLSGPTEASFLYPLFAENYPNSTTAVNFTMFLRTDPMFPKLWLRAIAFGNGGGTATWGINIDNGQIFEWYPQDGDEITVLGTSIFEVWSKEEKLYAQSSMLDFLKYCFSKILRNF